MLSSLVRFTVMSGAERRQHQRYDIRLGAEITVSGRTFTAATKDISAGGACVEAPHPLPEGGVVAVALFVVVDGIEEADFAPLQVTAHVQWTAEVDDPAVSWQYIAGLRFEQITDTQTQWLDGVVTRMSD